MSSTSETEHDRAMATSLSPESRALVACARVYLGLCDVSELLGALKECPDTDRLCSTAVAQGMLGHLQSLVDGKPASAVDPAVAERLAELQRTAAQRSLRQTGRLLRLLDALAAEGIAAMPLKGPAWAERLYGDITLRTWTDLDLLIVHGRIPRARSVLLAAGFEDTGRFNERLVAHKGGGWGQIALTDPEQGVHVELHWEVTVGLSARALHPEAVFSRAGHADLLGRQVPTPSAIDLLLITCLAGARDRWSTVERMLSLAVQIRAVDIDGWRPILEAARSVSCVRRLITAVAHVCGVFGLEVPPPVRHMVEHDPVGRSLLRSLGPESLDRHTGGSHAHLRLLWWRFATEDSLWAGLSHACLRFFRPGPEDWEAIALPAYMTSLYYPLRPLRLAGKWATRLVMAPRVRGQDYSKLAGRHAGPAHRRLEGGNG